MNEPRDPPRWVSSDAGAPEGLQRLFRHAERDVPSPSQLEGLAAKLGHLAPPTAPVVRPPLSRAARWALVGVGATVVAAGVGVVVLVARRVEVAPPISSASEPPPFASPAVPSAPAAPSTAAPAAPADEPSAPAGASTSGAVSPRERANVAPRSTLNRPPALSEAELLEQARKALARSPAAALALTRTHETTFASGVLRQEREVIAIEALRRLGRTAEANARAERFAKTYPGSAHRRSVEAGRPE